MAVSVILGAASFLLCSSCDGFLIHMRCDLVFYYKSTHMVMHFVNLTYRFVISFQSHVTSDQFPKNHGKFTAIHVLQNSSPANLFGNQIKENSRIIQGNSRSKNRVTSWHRIVSTDVMFLSSTEDTDEHGGELKKTKTITMFFTRKGRMEVRKRTEVGNENYSELTVN